MEIHPYCGVFSSIRPMIRLLSLLALAVAASLTFVSPVLAQSPGAAQANSAAYDLFSAGDYKGAAAAYEKLLKDYPTDAVVPSAQLQLAYAYFYLGQYDQAQTILTKTSSVPLPPEAKERIQGFLPQILIAKAGAMSANDPKRNATYQEAITKFTAFITAYPQSPELESAILNRGIAQFQLAKYAEAAKDFELNLQKFPQSSTIATSKNLLALTLAALASTELSKPSGANTAQALANFKRATDILREMITKQEDVTLMNEANFRLGEILFSQAQFGSEADKSATYQQALDAYRAVVPNEQIIALQQQVLKEFPERKRQAIQTRNENLRKQLDKDNERELRKLSELQGRPDQVPTALLKMAEIFYQQGKTNETRVILAHVDKALKDADDQKRALYLTTMTYALQSVPEKATSGYQSFQSKYKGDPIADNLPVTLGSMYLGLNKLPEAINYFNESLSLYPSGRFVGLSVVNKAQAESRTGKYEDAQKTFKEFLAKNPPADVGVIAQFGLANTYKDTKKWDDAIAAYQVVKQKYAGTPQATESDYWIGMSTQQKGDNAAAVPILDAFAKANPKSPLAPLAVYTKGAAQLALGQTEDGIAALAQVADEYPESLPAPFTYFTRMQLRMKEGKSDEAVALMRKFIEQYPKDDKVFVAYDTIAQTAISGGKTEEGLAAYREYVQNYPQSPQAADAIAKVADIQRGKAEALGRFGALNADEQSQWKTYMEGSIASAEELLQKYPESQAVSLGLQTLLRDQTLLVGAELKKPAEVEQYFQKLADSAGSPAAKSRLLFALASYVNETDSAKALGIMEKAYDPSIVYAPQVLDAYGLALLGKKDFAKATEIATKLATDYPNPAGVSPQQAPLPIQEAHASALFLRGRIAQEQGNLAEAGKLFEQLKALYAWSPKVLEANYGIAQSYKTQGKYDDALMLLAGVSRAQNTTAAIRANAMLLTAEIMLEKYKAETDPKKKEEFLNNAIDTNIKVPQFYESEAAQSSEGLWKGAQLIEEQVASITDPAIKTQQLNKAKSAYGMIVKSYPNSQYAPKAQERLNALGGQ